MKTSKSDNSEVNEVDFYYVVGIILRHKVFVLSVSALCAIVAAVVVFNKPNIYTSTISAVPPRQSSSTLDAAISSVGSTLREFGLTKLAGKKGDSFDFIVLLQSRRLQDSLIRQFQLAKVYNIPDSLPDKVRSEVADRVTVNLEMEGNYTVSVDDESPVRAAQMANYIVSVANTISSDLDKVETENLYHQYELKIAATDKQIEELRDSLAIYGRQHGLYSPLDQAKAAATALAEIKANRMKQEVLLSVIQQMYGSDDPMVAQQKQNVAALAAKETEAENTPGLLGNSSLNSAAGTAFPYIRMTAELEALVKLKAFLIPSVEQVRLDRTKNVPSLYVVDEAQAPQLKSRPKRSLIIGGSFVGSMLLAIVVVLGLAQFRYVSSKYRARMAQLAETTVDQSEQ